MNFFRLLFVAATWLSRRGTPRRRNVNPTAQAVGEGRQSERGLCREKVTMDQYNQTIDVVRDFLDQDGFQYDLCEDYPAIRTGFAGETARYSIRIIPHVA